jgi:hypothetical protein
MYQAEFQGRSINIQQARQLIAQANALLKQVKTLAGK